MNASYYIRKLAVLALAVLVIFSALFPYRSLIARAIWERYHNDTLPILIDAGNADFYFDLGEYYFDHEHYDIYRAQKYYQKTLSLKPNHLEAHYQLGRIHFIQGRFASALDEIKLVLNADPEFSKAHYMYGLIYGYAGNMTEAERGFKEFIRREPNEWAGYNDLAWIYFKQGKFKEASDTAKQGLATSPSNPWLNNVYGATLINLGKRVEARQVLELALLTSEAMRPENWGVSYPGNNPDIHDDGLEETRFIIRHNLNLLND